MRHVVVGVLLGALVGGCGPKRKIAECQAFVGVVNDAVEAVRATANNAPEAGRSAAELRALAEVLDGSQRKAETVSLSIEELARLRQRYREWLGDLAGAAREHADAVESVDVERTRNLERRLEELVSKEAPFADALNAFCHAP